MPATVASLRAYGARPIALVTREGTFEGTIVQELLGDGAIMLMLAPTSGATEQIVIALDAIEEIVER